VDEQKLSELFKTAAGDAPPASFDEQDVLNRSRQVTTRRRSMIAGGGGLAVVVVAAGLVFGTGVLGHSAGGGQAAASAPASGKAPFQHSLAGPEAVTPSGGFPTTSPVQGGGSAGGVGPGADGTLPGCGPADAKLAVALASELPSAGATPDKQVATPTVFECPPGGRAATYAVHAGSVTGTVTVALVPRGHGIVFQGDGPAPDQTDGGPSTSGKFTVLLFSLPSEDSKPAPISDHLGKIEKVIAAQY
jgi:hypothetical protein